VEYTSQAMRQVEGVISKEKNIIGAFSVVGFSFTGSGANKGMVFLNLANIDKRKGEQNSAASIVARLRGPLSQLTDIQAFPFLPPAAVCSSRCSPPVPDRPWSGWPKR